MSLGAGELMILAAAVIAFWVAPTLILLAISDNKGRSMHFAWWGIGLGWLGLIIGAIIMLLGPRQQRS